MEEGLFEEDVPKLSDEVCCFAHNQESLSKLKLPTNILKSQIPDVIKKCVDFRYFISFENGKYIK